MNSAGVELVVNNVMSIYLFDYFCEQGQAFANFVFFLKKLKHNIGVFFDSTESAPCGVGDYVNTTGGIDHNPSPILLNWNSLWWTGPGEIQWCREVLNFD